MKIATLAIILRGDEVLLGYKKSGEIGTATINGPGGKCEAGETPQDCVIRETREEVGIELDPTALVEVAVITFFAGGIPDFRVHVFRTRVFAGEPVETESMIPGWYPEAQLPLNRMLESDREWFARTVSGPYFEANVYYRERARDFERITFH